MIDLGKIKQGERGTLAISWEFPDSLTSPASISGGVVTAVMENLDTGDVTAVTGTLTATATTAATWELSAGDSGTYGTYFVTFQAIVGGVTTYTLNAKLEIEENPAATASQNPALVTIPVADAAWVSAGAAGGALGDAAYEDTDAFDAAGTAATLDAALDTRLDVLEAAMIPAAVADLAATANGSAAIDLAWTYTAVALITGFKIYRKTGLGSYALIDTAADDAVSYADSGLDASTEYTYRVDAYNTFFASTGNEDSATTADLVLTFTFSEYADGALPAGLAGATWAISGGKAINTPSLGSELLTNGNMETGSPPTGWSTTGAITSVADERTGGAGSTSLNLNNNGTIGRIVYQTQTSANHKWHVFNAWGKGISGKRLAINISNGAFTALNDSGRAAYADWANLIISARSNSTSTMALMGGDTSSGTDECRMDDASLKAVDDAALFATLDAGFADATCRANGITQAQYTQFGVVLNLDSASSPANFVVGYYHRGQGKVRLDKCVAGVYTNLVDVTTTYVAGSEVKVVKSGTTYQIFYNDVQKGTDQTISDAGIVDNTMHGLFSTGGGGAVDAFFCE